MQNTILTTKKKKRVFKHGKQYRPHAVLEIWERYTVPNNWLNRA